MAELQLLPDHILKKQTCTNCFKYLSVLPVTQNKKGELFCGRCKTDSKYKVPNTMFNIVAKKYLFKCVNHYEGCKKLLNVNSSEDHEKECNITHTRECFFCSFLGNWCQIVQHCLKEHSSNVTENGIFQFEIGSSLSQKLIFIAKDNIFFLTIEVTEEKFYMVISLHVKDDLLINQFAVKFFMPSDSTNEQFIFTDYSLFDVNSLNYFEKSIAELVSHFGRKTKISCQILLKQVSLSHKESELEKRFVRFNVRQRDLLKLECSIKKREIDFMEQNKCLQPLTNLIKKILPSHLKCVNCEKYVAGPIYFCSQSHGYCADCLSNRCEMCKKICEFSDVIELHSISVSCDWPNCTESSSLRNYLDHKSKCLFRPYKCPLNGCPDTVFSCERLTSHWHCRVPSLVFETGFIEYDAYGEYEFYWLLSNDLYHVIIQFLLSSLKVIVEKTNVLLNNYQFVVEVSDNGSHTYNRKIIGCTICDKYLVIDNLQKGRYNDVRISRKT